jgi:hypothetical protein
MSTTDDYRFQSHHLLLELDASTNHMMMLVSARQTSGYPWEEAARRQKLAYETWAAFLNAPQTDPMPTLDGRAEGSYEPLAD